MTLDVRFVCLHDLLTESHHSLEVGRLRVSRESKAVEVLRASVVGRWLLFDVGGTETIPSRAVLVACDVT